MPDPSGLTNDDLKAALLAHGVKAGPIVGEVALNTVLKLVLELRCTVYLHSILSLFFFYLKSNSYSIVCLC